MLFQREWLQWPQLESIPGTLPAVQPKDRERVGRKLNLPDSPVSRSSGAPQPDPSACFLRVQSVHQNRVSPSARSTTEGRGRRTETLKRLPAKAPVASVVSACWWTIICHPYLVRRVLL